MTRLISRSGNATSLPYFFGPGNHEVDSPLQQHIQHAGAQPKQQQQ
jgi:hypothetical protein